MKKKIRLGKQTKDGYQYRTTGNLGPDLTTQIEKFVKEKEMKDQLKREVNKLSEVVKIFKDQEKKNNIVYYHEVGKNLKFLEKRGFKKVEPWSAFKLIYEWLPGLIPHISGTELGTKHIGMMYYLGKVEKKELSKATWWQWYEIVKFPELFTKDKKYKEILSLIKKKGLDGSIRLTIKKALKGQKTRN